MGDLNQHTVRTKNKRSLGRKELFLRKKLRRYIRRGHPWVFDQGIAWQEGIRAGELVKVCDEQGCLALAYADPNSPIRLRIVDLEPNARVDGNWLHYKIKKSANRRQSDISLSDTNALRLLHGEADGVPGLVIDWYAEHAIVLLDGEGAEALWKPYREDIERALVDAGYPVQSLSMRKIGRTRNWIGDAPPEGVVIQEGPASMEVDLRRGQKTGLFLDQRENRRLIGARSAGLRVLNLFSYTGGFSLMAALGGALKTTSVDIAAPAVKASQRNFSMNGLSLKSHEFICADVFDYLSGCIDSGRVFDVVICDPPSFASSEKALKKGLRAYKRVNEQAMRVVAPGGVYCSASCSSHVTDVHLLEVLADASHAAGRDLVVTEGRGAASDHPVRPGFPEGRYLSFFHCLLS